MNGLSEKPAHILEIELVSSGGLFSGLFISVRQGKNPDAIEITAGEYRRERTWTVLVGEILQSCIDKRALKDPKYFTAEFREAYRETLAEALLVSVLREAVETIEEL